MATTIITSTFIWLINETYTNEMEVKKKKRNTRNTLQRYEYHGMRTLHTKFQ